MLVFFYFIFLQIIAESFPISSSGHIMLALEILRDYDYHLYSYIFSLLQRSDVMFALHGPTAIIIMLFYAPRWKPFFHKFKKNIKLFFKIIGYVSAANGMTIVCYLIIKNLSLALPLWVGFTITFFLLITSSRDDSSNSSLQLHHFLLLGLVQGIAVLPGISRLAAVYAAGRIMNLASKKAFDVAWMLQFPLILGAACFGWGTLIYQHENVMLSQSTLIAVSVGSIIAFFGFYSMNLLVKHNNMWFMAWYILIPLLLSLWYTT